MDTLLPCIGRGFCIRRGKGNGCILCRIEVLFVPGIQPVEFCAADAKRALRIVHALHVHVLPVLLHRRAIQMNVNLIFCTLISAHAVPFFIGSIAELGVHDALVDGSNCHVDACTDTAYGSARHAAVKAARFFRCHIGIIRRLDRAACHMGADAAVDVVQGDGNSDTSEASGAHAARGICRQAVSGLHIDIVSFKIAAGHNGRGFTGSIVDPHIGSQPRAKAHS